MPIGVTIRPVEKDDIIYLYKWNTQEFVGEWQSFQYKSLPLFIKRFESGEFNDGKLQIFIIERTGERCGMCVIAFESQYVTRIGMSLLNSVQGCGICQIALHHVLAYIFNNYLTERVEADTDVGNLRGIKALERFGFVREGILRHYRFHHGAFHDNILLSFLRTDWNEKRLKESPTASCQYQLA